MVESAGTTANDLRSAIEDALAAGVVTRDEILDMVPTIDPQSGNGHETAVPATSADDLPIYTELPEGLIDLPTAMRKYGCHRQRLNNWVARGRLKVYGRLRGPARGGGYLVVSEDDLQSRLNGPLDKGGRPRKRVKPDIAGT